MVCHTIATWRLSMHPYVTPQSIKDRVLRRQGKLLSHDTIDAGRTALVVVDMQNYFVAEGFGAEVPAAREIVPNINRMAKALRAAGGTVVWIQTTATGALEKWGNFHTHMMVPGRKERRIAELDEGHEGFKVYPKLEPLPTDLRVKKIKYSAFIHGSSDLDAQLKSRGIEHLLITGTVTNVCCESTARDAMMLDYRVVMLSDGNASLSDEEHAASLNNFMVFFGDVMTTDEAIARLEPVAQRKRA
jgi:ureidoacrylate peracid hydrolase